MFTPREEAILDAVLEGARSYDELAAALTPSITPRTAEAHVLSIYKRIRDEPGVHGGPLMAVVVWSVTNWPGEHSA